MIVGLGRVDLVCRDLERSLAFYRDVFGPLGLHEPVLFEGERGEQIHYLRFPTPGSGSHAPREWLQYHPEYYATFFLDPDGFRIEVSAARDARL